MKIFSVYDLATGEIVQIRKTSSDEIDTPEGFGAIEGEYDPLMFTVANGAVQPVSQSVIDARQAEEDQRLAQELLDSITAERDRRIASNFTFNGVAYDFDQTSKGRVTGAAALAGFAMQSGAAVGDLYWHGGTDPFVWVAADNSINSMDAQTVFAFGQEAAAHESRHIFWARALKDADPIPADFTNDQYWQ